MRLLHKDFKFIFEFRENGRNILIIENPKTFVNFIEELSGGELMGESRFVLSENETPMELKKYLCCIVNPMTVSPNERRILGKLYDSLKNEIMRSDLLLENNAILASLEAYISRVIQCSDYDLIFADEIDVPSIFKLMNIRFEDNPETLLEKIVNYIEVMYGLMGTGCFVFVHLFSYLTEYELEKLFEYVQYRKINILLIESHSPENMEQFSNAVIIDRDNCEILLSV